MMKFLSDDKGTRSSMRLVVFLVTIIMVSTWSITVLRSGQWIPLDVGSVAALIGMLWMKNNSRKIETRLEGGQ